MVTLPKALLLSLITQCGTGVDPITTQTVIKVESSGNPYAIALVNTKKKITQPETEADAIKIANQLEAENIDFSAGLMQINKRNFKALGLTNETVFQACKNIEAGTLVLKACYLRAKQATPHKNEQALLRDAMSCYYSGNTKRGYQKEGKEKVSYIDLVEKQVTKTDITVPQIKKIEQPSPKNSSEKNSWDVFKDF